MSKFLISRLCQAVEENDDALFLKIFPLVSGSLKEKSKQSISIIRLLRQSVFATRHIKPAIIRAICAEKEIIDIVRGNIEDARGLLFDSVWLGMTGSVKHFIKRGALKGISSKEFYDSLEDACAKLMISSQRQAILSLKMVLNASPWRDSWLNLRAIVRGLCKSCYFIGLGFVNAVMRLLVSMGYSEASDFIGCRDIYELNDIYEFKDKYRKYGWRYCLIINRKS